jgi:hypothetical protein
MQQIFQAAGGQVGLTHDGANFWLVVEKATQGSR